MEPFNKIMSLICIKERGSHALRNHLTISQKVNEVNTQLWTSPLWLSFCCANTALLLGYLITLSAPDSRDATSSKNLYICNLKEATSIYPSTSRRPYHHLSISDTRGTLSFTYTIWTPFWTPISSNHGYNKKRTAVHYVHTTCICGKKAWAHICSQSV